MGSTAVPDQRRDADRSRSAILEAAERLFSADGYDRTSLSGIGTAAGLSRGAPTYFFGSKQDLYRVVLERVLEARQEATAEAFSSVVDWTEGEGDLGELRDALRLAVKRYMDFLTTRRSFIRLISWEELAGGGALSRVQHESTAVEDAFASLRATGRRRGIRSFDVDDGVWLFISLTFGPLAQQATMRARSGRDLGDPALRRRHIKLVVEHLMLFLTGSSVTSA